MTDWAKECPRELKKNLKFRLELEEACEGSRRVRKAVLEACRADILFWINSFVWQFNPNLMLWQSWKGGPSRDAESGEFSFQRTFGIRRGESIGPFVTWPCQEKAILTTQRCIETGEDLIWEKSREMGASWINVLILLHGWLFEPMSKFLLISRNVDAVDKRGDPDCLLWKFDFALKYLPKWMRPKKDESKEMMRQNLDNGSVINGAASGGISGSKAGVGGRARAIFVDEFSLIDQARELYSHTSDTGSARIFNFTHRGTGAFASELTRRSSVRKLHLHWSQHPEKNKGLYRYNLETKQLEILDKDFEFPPDYPHVLDGRPAGGPYPGLRSPWYDYNAGRKASDAEVAMDYDINPEGSMEQVYDPILVRNLIAEGCRLPDWQGDIEYDPDTARFIRLVSRRGGPLRLWCPLDGQGRPVKSRYTIGGDISAGTGATPTCFSVFDCGKSEKVAQYTNSRIDAKEAGKLMVAMGWLFQDDQGRGAFLIWELQGPGVSAGEKILEIGYLHIFMRNTDDVRLDRKASLTPGWVPTPQNQYRLHVDYREALRTREFLNPDEAALRETQQFRWEAGYPVHDLEDCDTQSGARASHADHVIADGLSWKGAKVKGVERRPRKQEDVPPLLSRDWRKWYTDPERRARQDEELAGAWWR